MNNLQSIFGVPIYFSNINPNFYNKEKIIRTIEKNYEIDPQRNNWDIEETTLHHSANDTLNDKFEKINFLELIDLYGQQFSNFFDQIPTKKRFEFEMSIANYTCMSKGHLMKRHVHTDCHFTGVHYIKFNPQKHSSTKYYNPAAWGEFIGGLLKYDECMINFDLDSMTNSWLKSSWSFETNEDDFVIIPAVLPHSVPLCNSDETRMTIVVNVKLL